MKAVFAYIFILIWILLYSPACSNKAKIKESGKIDSVSKKEAREKKKEDEGEGGCCHMSHSPVAYYVTDPRTTLTFNCVVLSPR